LKNKLIQIASSTNTIKQLESDMLDAYEKANIKSAKLENLRRTLALHKSVKAQLSDTQISYDTIKNGMNVRIEKEMSVSNQLTSELNQAKMDDGKQETHYIHHNHRSGWWLWRRYHSYTTSYTTTKDTSKKQASITKSIQDTDNRMMTLKNGIENMSSDRRKKEQDCEAEIRNLEEHCTRIEGRCKILFDTARELEERLNEQKLIAAGVSEENARNLREAFQISLPLFDKMTDNVARITSQFETLNVMMKGLQAVKAPVALGIFDSIAKMAIIGDYVTSDFFAVCLDPGFQNSLNMRVVQYNELAQMVQNESTKLTRKTIMDISDMNPNSKVEMNEYKETVKPKAIDIYDFEG